MLSSVAPGQNSNLRQNSSKGASYVQICDLHISHPGLELPITDPSLNLVTLFIHDCLRNRKAILTLKIVSNAADATSLVAVA